MLIRRGEGPQIVGPDSPKRVNPEEVWPQTCPRYGTAISAWGDTFIACGRMQEILRRTNSQQIGVIYYGRHPQIVDFLKFQPWVREVVHRQQRSHDELLKIANYNVVPADLKKMIGSIPEEDVWPTHIRIDVDRMEDYPYRDALLPPESWQWANSVRAGLPPDTYFLHPWSFQSASPKNHWPHWQQLVSRLLRTTGATYVLTGQGYSPGAFGNHKRLVNLIDQTQHMHDALALACLCKGSISTVNSFGLWSAVRRLNAFVISNDAIVPKGNNIFGRFMRASDSIDWHWKHESLAEVHEAALRWINE